MENVGLRPNRFKSDPLEKKFARIWDEWNPTNRCGSIHAAIIDHLLAEKPGNPQGEVSERDRQVAATVVQWLGSIVGCSFLSDVLDIDVRKVKYEYERVARKDGDDKK